MNIIDPILFHSRHDPEALALCAPGVDLVTYERLHKSINNVARRASALGLKPGQIVALFLPQRPIIHEWENWSALHSDELDDPNVVEYFLRHLQTRTSCLLGFKFEYSQVLVQSIITGLSRSNR